MEGSNPTTMSAAAPSVRIDALDMFVELLAQVEGDASSDAFYGRLCEATCALTSMDRAVIFRYDEARRRVRAHDRARREYARRAFGVDSDDWTLYHLIVDTVALGIDPSVGLVVLASRARTTQPLTES